MKISLKVIVILATCLAIFLSASADEVDEQKLYLEAKQLLDDYRGDWSNLNKAQSLLRKILKQNPNSALAYVGLSRLTSKSGYIKSGEYEPGSLKKAQELLNKAIQIDPDLYDAYFHGTFLYIRSNELPIAKQFAKKAYDIDPDSAKTDLLFATIAREEDDYDEVVRRSNAVLSKTTDKTLIHDAHYNLLKIYLRHEQYDLVNAIYLEDIDLFPNDPWLLDAYANFLYCRDDINGAIEYGEKALAIMNFGMAHKHLGRAYYEKGSKFLWEEKSYEQSIDFFAKAIQHRPTANAYYGLGIAYWHTGHQNRDVSLLKKAEQSLKKAVELDPNHEQAQKQLNDLSRQLRAHGH